MASRRPLAIVPQTFDEAFRGRRATLVDKLDVSHGLLNELLDREILTPQQVSHCRSMQSEHERANKMLELLERRDDALFPGFCAALVACDQQHIVEAFFTGPAPAAVPQNDFAIPQQVQAFSRSYHSGRAAGAAVTAGGHRPTTELAKFRQSGIVKLPSDQLPAEVARIRFSDMTDLEAMAEGGFGIVFRANHINWGVVAYKELKSTIMKETDKISRELIKEAQMHVLRHPNIVAMLAVTFEAGHYGVVFEYVTFGGLDGFIEAYTVEWLMKLSIAHGAVRGLNYIHTREPPVVHGDIKVQNVLIDDGFVPKICDFGLSKWHNYSTTRTKSQTQRGTVTHIPPENWQNINQRRTVKFDIYGFGILLWELLSEAQPFGQAGANGAQIQAAVVAGQRPDLEEIRKEDGEDGTEVSDDIYQFACDCIQQCWDQDPNKRPSFSDLDKRFEDFLVQRDDGVTRARNNLVTAVQLSLSTEDGVA